MEKVDKEGNRTESANELTGFLLLQPGDYAELLALNDRSVVTDEDREAEPVDEECDEPDKRPDLGL
jgi:hypothetical protein